MIKILWNKDYKDLLDQIEQAEKSTIRENREKNDIRKELERLKIDYSSMKQIKDKHIKELEKKIENDSITIQNNKAVIDELEKYQHKITGQQGGYTKEINKLKKQVDLKSRVIEEYKKAIAESEQKNELQAQKIKELLSKAEHETIEYENDGLPKQSKESLKNLRKKRRK